MDKLKNLLLLTTILSFSVFSADRLPFVSSFETNDFSEWDGGLEQTLTVTNSDSSDGNYSAQAEMINGSSADNYKDFYFGDHIYSPIPNGEAADDELWLQYDLKFDNVFNFGQNERIHKTAIINFEDENGRRRYQVIINVIPRTDVFTDLTLTSALDVFNIEILSWNADRTLGPGLGFLFQNIDPDNLLSFRRGQWDALKLFMKLNTPGINNGIIRLWVNNQKIMEYTDIAMRADSNYNPNKLLLSNYTRVLDQSGFQRWDNFYLSEDEPGNVLRPNPPVLHTVN